MTARREVTVADFLSQHADVQQVDVILTDINGIWRGKRIRPADAVALDEGRFAFPMNTAALTTTGAVSDAVIKDWGAEPDRTAIPIAGGMVRVPWLDTPTIQVMVDLVDTDGSPLFLSPRTVLQRILDRFRELGLLPVVAVELEFYLFERGSVPPKPLVPLNGQTPMEGEQCNAMDGLDDYAPLLDDIRRTAEIQGLAYKGMLKEGSAGQFEINLGHHGDAVRAADEAILLKRIIRGVADQYGAHASFMAKPREGMAGSGQHFHISVQDEDGSNIFNDSNYESVTDSNLGYAASGLMTHMDAAMAFYAPNANSFRRFDWDWYAAPVKAWAKNNRFMAIRVPASDAANTRLEVRLAGADASPHLGLAAALAGVLLGLEAKKAAPAMLGECEVPPPDLPSAPVRWHSALDALAKDAAFRALYDPKFLKHYLGLRRLEEDQFHRTITDREYSELLRVL